MKKIVINIGLKEALTDKKILEAVGEQLAQITGQKAVTTFAHRAIAGFKIRQGDPLGLKVTLRGKKMKDFYRRLVTIVLPRTRDFQGVSLKGFDKQGNYTLGIKEIIVFSEIDLAKIDKQRGLEITIVTGAKNPEEAKLSLTETGMPFEKKFEARNPKY